MKQQTLFLFLHGAGVGPWVWERTREHLPFESLALTYPGRKADATPETCAEAIIAELNHRLHADSKTDANIIVVLHSLAGVLAGPLALALGKRLQRVVLLSAIVPAPKQNFAQTMGFPVRWILPLLFRMNPKGLKPSPSMIRHELAHDLSPEDADRIISEYQAEFPGLYLSSPSPLPEKTPLSFIQLLQDRSVSPPLQQKIIHRLLITNTYTLDAGHMAMLSQPEKLARLLETIGNQSIEPSILQHAGHQQGH